MTISRKLGKVRGLLLNKDIHNKERGSSFCSRRIKASKPDWANNVPSKDPMQQITWRRYAKKPNMKRSFLEIINKKGKKVR